MAMTLSDQQLAAVARRLLAWYARHRRRLPWRRRPTPYRVWVSEIMLQQTVVGTVRERFDEWMRRFPSLAALARASEREVLAAWEGLGYYRRAVALRRAARLVVKNHRGKLPGTRKELLALPGIGPYTASAILSLAFGRDEVAVDANVARVFVRLLALEGHGSEARVRSAVEEHARRALPSGRSADFNQALMDFGSLVCRPANPDCAACPLGNVCLARKKGLQHDIPSRKRKQLKKITTTIAVFLRRGSVYLQQRPAGACSRACGSSPAARSSRARRPARPWCANSKKNSASRARRARSCPWSCTTTPSSRCTCTRSCARRRGGCPRTGATDGSGGRTLQATRCRAPTGR